MRLHWISWILRTYLIVGLLFVFAPAISLVLFSLQEAKVQSFPIQRYSTRWYRAAWEDQEIRAGVRNSLIVGGIASLLSTGLGFVSAHLLSRRRPRRELLYVIFVSLPVVVPLLLSGIALLNYFNQVRLTGSLWAVIIAHTCFCSPFALGLLVNPYERLNIELERAAMNLGASGARIVRQIVIPQLWPAIAAAGLLCFLVSWDEFILAWFVGGFTKTLPVVIYGMMGSSFNPSLNAVGTLSMVVSGGVLFGVFVLKRLADRLAVSR